MCEELGTHRKLDQACRRTGQWAAPAESSESSVNWTPCTRRAAPPLGGRWGKRGTRHHCAVLLPLLHRQSICDSLSSVLNPSHLSTAPPSHSPSSDFSYWCHLSGHSTTSLCCGPQDHPGFWVFSKRDSASKRDTVALTAMLYYSKRHKANPAQREGPGGDIQKKAGQAQAGTP